mgnify:CR=1 FL=1
MRAYLKFIAFLAVATAAALDQPPCPELLERLPPGPLRDMAAHRFVERLAADPDVQAIAKRVATPGSFQVDSPFQLEGSTHQEDDTLTIRLSGISVPARRVGANLSIWEMKALSMGYVDVHKRPDTPDRTLAKATAAVFVAIERQLAETPQIRHLHVEAKGVQNAHLRELLQSRFGFEVRGVYTAGMVGSTYDLKLYVDLEKS